MTFITYAQNCEDVLLWRALGTVEAGFYIDVGANDPVEHSVTKAFYDQGWRGINLEPLPGFHEAFVTQRPRDINLAVAAGASAGEVTLYDVPAVNGWATVDAQVANAHQAEGFALATLKVPMRTLASVCEEHASGDIHFLKIDVEGFEGEVLKGMDFERWRPWVVVVEATLPNSREVNFAAWEHLVTDHGYTFAYFDGLNRYYVAPEHADLLAPLSVQANVFDAFLSYHLVWAWDSAKAAVEREKAAEARVAHFGELAAQAQAHAEVVQEQAQTAVQAASAQAQAAQQQAQASEQRAQASEQQAQAAQQQAQAAELQAQAAHRQAQAFELEAQAAQAYAKTVTDLHEAQRLEMQRVAVWARDLEAQLLGIHQSLMWRMTAPLRYLMRKPWSGWSVRKARTAVVRWLVARESLLAVAVPVIRLFPPLYDRMYGAAVHAMQAADGAEEREVVAVELAGISGPARRVYADLVRVTGLEKAE